ncbi:MAG: nitrilase-related carbon-nitrogen hydrolase [Spirochaetaceae bacterium]
MLTIAVAQTKPTFLDNFANYENAFELIESVHADIYLFPELFLSGYTFSTRDEVESIALPRRNTYFDGFRTLSRERGIGICGGYAEAGDTTVYNSSFFIGDGELLAHYRKAHLFYRETQFFTPGDSGFSVFEYKGARLGMMVCFDWIFPEAARSLALLGAQIILHPSNLVLPYCQRAMYARSVENRVYIATANRVGTESNTLGDELTFTGQSQVVSPNGTYILTFGETEQAIRTVDVDPTAADEKNLNQFNNIFDDMRPEMYCTGTR